MSKKKPELGLRYCKDVGQENGNVADTDICLVRLDTMEPVEPIVAEKSGWFDRDVTFTIRGNEKYNITYAIEGGLLLKRMRSKNPLNPPRIGPEGAVALVYPGYLKYVADGLETDELYIIPLSMDKLEFFKEMPFGGLDFLISKSYMSSHLFPSSRALSDSVFHYDKNTDKLHTIYYGGNPRITQEPTFIKENTNVED